MVIKVLRRRRKILGFTILLQAGVSFNHDPKEFASFEIHPSTTLKYAIFFVSRYPKRVALHTHIRHPNPIGLHIDMIQIIDHTMIVRDVRTRFSGESSRWGFCHLGKGMNSGICSGIRLLYTRSQRGGYPPLLSW
jgi:hypothetical protein